MLSSLVLVAAMAGGTVRVDQYQIPLTGPFHDGFVDWKNPEENRREAEAGKLRLINVYVGKDRMRCDTDDAISVIKRNDEYIFLDHRKKEALVFSKAVKEQGKRAACATTPFWPEAYGDMTSLEEAKARLKAKTAISGFKDDALSISYSPFSPEDYAMRWKSGFTCDYSINPLPCVAIHNTWFLANDHSGLKVNWMAQSQYDDGMQLHEPIQIPASRFTVPDNYALFVSVETSEYPKARVLFEAETRAFVDRFPIQNAFPKSLLPGEGG
ncbi:MAG TPA: hypothetical protein VNI20_00825 [Fimbriimonadaceae bacterium]|nr:hypothetical protein [Fimbriimonadaceae bacterium]